MKRLADQTLYEILEVPPDAPPAAIAEAVERARALYEPGSLATYTLISTEEASLLTRRIGEAQSILLDPAARARYDAALSGPADATKAAASGSNGTPAPAHPWGIPPVIPAIRPEPPVADPERGAPAGEPAPPPPPAAPAPRAPILLHREVAPPPSAEPPAPSAPSAPAAPPAEPLAATSARTPPPVAPTNAPAPPTPPPPPASAPTLVPDDTAWTGEVLRRLREARGLSLQQIAERTKVTRHHIENIEGDRYSALPAAVYLRGILLTIARELRLDGPKVARSYLERAASGTAAPGSGKSR